MRETRYACRYLVVNLFESGRLEDVEVGVVLLMCI